MREQRRSLERIHHFLLERNENEGGWKVEGGSKKGAKERGKERRVGRMEEEGMGEVAGGKEGKEKEGMRSSEGGREGGRRE